MEIKLTETSRCKPAETPKVVDSREILDQNKWVHIHHDGQMYRLTITRQNKLILTK